jgi:hypothetical protein
MICAWRMCMKYVYVVIASQTALYLPLLSCSPDPTTMRKPFFFNPDRNNLIFVYFFILLKNLFLGSSYLGPLTTSLTPSLNPKMTLIKFMCHVTPRVFVNFFLIFGLQHYFCFYLPHFFFTFELKDQCRQIVHVLY